VTLSWVVHIYLTWKSIFYHEEREVEHEIHLQQDAPLPNIGVKQGLSMGRQATEILRDIERKDKHHTSFGSAIFATAI
jgi:hypothetical protein